MTETKSLITDRSKLWAKRSAVHYLGTYSSSVENLRQTVEKRALRKYEGISEDEARELANHAVDFCVENKFVSDESYADTKAAAGSRKGHSRSRIRMSLEQKGVDREIASTALEVVDDLENAIIFAKRKRFGPWRTRELDIKQKQRELGAFARNMFPGGIASKVINMDLAEAEELLNPSTLRY